jgi:tellurite resistance protein
MSKYSAIFQSEAEISEELTPVEAIAAISIIAIYADGQPTDEEWQLLSECMQQCGVDTAEEWETLTQKINNLLAEEKVEPGALFNAAVDSIPDEFVETAFKTAIVFASTDGQITEAESEYTIDLGTALGLSEEEITDIIDELFGEEEEYADEEEEEEEYADEEEYDEDEE